MNNYIDSQLIDQMEDSKLKDNQELQNQNGIQQDQQQEVQQNDHQEVQQNDQQEIQQNDQQDIQHNDQQEKQTIEQEMETTEQKLIDQNDKNEILINDQQEIQQNEQLVGKVYVSNNQYGTVEKVVTTIQPILNTPPNEQDENDIFHEFTKIFYQESKTQPDKQNIPSGRFGASLIQQKFYIYLYGGGSIENKESDLNAMYQLDIQNLVWKKINKRQASNSILRDNHSLLVYDKTMFMFGGFNGKKYCNDINKYTVRQKQWTKIKTYGNRPQARSAQASCKFNRQFLLIHGGGYGFNKLLNDFYLFDINKKYWVQVEHLSGEQLPLVEGHKCIQYHRQVYFFGGETETKYDENNKKIRSFSNDLHCVNLFWRSKDGQPRSEWEKVEPKGIKPSPRSQHTLMNYRNEFLIVIAGEGYCNEQPKLDEQKDFEYEQYSIYTKNDFWIYHVESFTWQELDINKYAPGFQKRSCFSSCECDNKIFIFGGIKRHDSERTKLTIDNDICIFHFPQNIVTAQQKRSIQVTYKRIIKISIEQQDESSDESLIQEIETECSLCHISLEEQQKKANQIQQEQVQDLYNEDSSEEKVIINEEKEINDKPELEDLICIKRENKGIRQIFDAMANQIKWPLRCFSMLLDISYFLKATTVSISTNWQEKDLRKDSSMMKYIKVQSDVQDLNYDDLTQISQANDLELDQDLYFQNKAKKLDYYGTILKLVSLRLGKEFIYLSYDETTCYLLYFPGISNDNDYNYQLQWNRKSQKMMQYGKNNNHIRNIVSKTIQKYNLEKEILSPSFLFQKGTILFILDPVCEEIGVIKNKTSNDIYWKGYQYINEQRIPFKEKLFYIDFSLRQYFSYYFYPVPNNFKVILNQQQIQFYNQEKLYDEILQNYNKKFLVKSYDKSILNIKDKTSSSLLFLQLPIDQNLSMFNKKLKIYNKTHSKYEQRNQKNTPQKKQGILIYNKKILRKKKKGDNYNNNKKKQYICFGVLQSRIEQNQFGDISCYFNHMKNNQQKNQFEFFKNYGNIQIKNHQNIDFINGQFQPFISDYQIKTRISKLLHKAIKTNYDQIQQKENQKKLLKKQEQEKLLQQSQLQLQNQLTGQNFNKMFQLNQQQQQQQLINNLYQNQYQQPIPQNFYGNNKMNNQRLNQNFGQNPYMQMM